MGRGLDSLRLAVGTFTIVPVHPPAVVDARTARGALLLTPLVGAALGGAAGIVLELTRTLTNHSIAGRLLAALLAVCTLVVLSGALHLDGLADTVDGLAAGGTPEHRLAVMKRSDVGPYAVVVLVLALLVATAAAAESISRGTGWLGLLGAAVAGRTAVVHACVRGVPAARTDGLGTAWAEAVGRGQAWALTVVTAVVMAGVAWFDDDRGWALSVRAATAVVLAAVAAALLVRRCRRAIGGVTGDVMGAVIEIGTTLALLAFALA